MNKILTLALPCLFFAALAIPVSAFGVTTTFTNNEDNVWDNFNNWDGGIPVDGDTVYIEGDVEYGPNAPITLANLYVSQSSSGGDLSSITSTITVVGTTVFGFTGQYTGGFSSGTLVSSSIVFNENSQHTNGSIIGDVVFNDTSYSANGSIIGDVVFNDDSQTICGVGVQIVGNVTFNESSSHECGTITGDVTFYDSSYLGNAGIDGDVVFNETSANNGGNIFGNVTLNDSTLLQGTITGTTTLNDNSYIQATTDGNVIFNDNSRDEGATINGDATFNTTYYDAAAPSGGVFIISGSNYWSGAISGTVFGSDNQPITRYVFRDSSINVNVINGDACFAPTATNIGTVSGTISICDTTAPTITSVSSDKANGTYDVGEVIDIDITISEAVTSTGNVTVTLETGTTDRTCTFTVLNGTTGTCNYTVQAGDTSADLTVSSISGTIADQSANAMSNFVPATNLAANKALVIDTTESTPDPEPEESAEEEEAPRRSGSRRSVSSNSNTSSSPSPLSFTLGQSDQTVTNLQTFLVQAGYLTMPPGVSYGYFGPLTQAALSAYSAAQGAPVTPTTSSPTFSRDLTTGTQSEDVRALQVFLNSRGFTIASEGPGSPGNETDFFGALTRAALIRFQIANGITPAVGYFGPVTRGVAGLLK